MPPEEASGRLLASKTQPPSRLSKNARIWTAESPRCSPETHTLFVNRLHPNIKQKLVLLFF